MSIALLPIMVKNCPILPNQHNLYHIWNKLQFILFTLLQLLKQHIQALVQHQDNNSWWFNQDDTEQQGGKKEFLCRSCRFCIFHYQFWIWHSLWCLIMFILGRHGKAIQQRVIIGMAMYSTQLAVICTSNDYSSEKEGKWNLFSFILPLSKKKKGW